MTLDEAIDHAKNMGEKMTLQCKTCACGQEHLQLAKWLEELKRYRKTYGSFPESSDYIVFTEIL